MTTHTNIRYVYALRAKDNHDIYGTGYTMPHDINTDNKAIAWAKNHMQEYDGQLIENIECVTTIIRPISQV